MLGFASLLTVYSLVTRSNVELDISRDRNVLYRELANGDIENHYNLKILNKDRIRHQYQISVDGLDNPTLEVDGASLQVAAATANNFQIRVVADPGSLTSNVNTIQFNLRALDDPSISMVSDARFMGP